MRRGLWDDELRAGVRFRRSDGRSLCEADACEYLAARAIHPRSRARDPLAFSARVLAFESKLEGRDGAAATARFLKVAGFAGVPGPALWEFRRQLQAHATALALAPPDAPEMDFASTIYPPPPPAAAPEEATIPAAWRPSDELRRRLPKHPFPAAAGPILDSFVALPGFLVVGPRPTGDALRRLGAYRDVLATGDGRGDAAVRARCARLERALLDAAPLYLSGDGLRACLAYFFATVYGLSAAAAAATLRRLEAAAVGTARRPPRRDDAAACARLLRDDAGARRPAARRDDAPPAEDGLLRAAFELGQAEQREALHAGPPRVGVGR
jgi:hypothetical protein